MYCVARSRRCFVFCPSEPPSQVGLSPLAQAISRSASLRRSPPQPRPRELSFTFLVRFVLYCQQISSKGMKGAQYGQFLAYQNNPNEFALGLKDACCKEPCCCLLSGFGSPCGFTACWARSKVLDTYYNGVQDFICCQGYIPGCCCITPTECCPGSMVGLCCEGCCFPITSLSIARLHLMDSKRIHPDPCDWQIIACANCLQLIACIFQILAIFFDELREAAWILELVADLVVFSVAGTLLCRQRRVRCNRVAIACGFARLLRRGFASMNRICIAIAHAAQRCAKPHPSMCVARG